MKIIQYQPSYKKEVQDICISQSTSRFKDDKAKKATLALYCDEYLDKELAFLLLNDEDKVVGYILCATDFHTYEQNMLPYIDILKENDNEKYHRYFNTNNLYIPYCDKYPAHLHIDLLEEYTGGGNGTKLMHTLLNYLKDKLVPGIMVIVDPHNKRAVSFYLKMGFKAIDDAGSILVQKL